MRASYRVEAGRVRGEEQARVDVRGPRVVAARPVVIGARAWAGQCSGEEVGRHLEGGIAVTN